MATIANDWVILLEPHTTIDHCFESSDRSIYKQLKLSVLPVFPLEEYAHCDPSGEVKFTKIAVVFREPLMENGTKVNNLLLPL